MKAQPTLVRRPRVLVRRQTVWDEGDRDLWGSASEWVGAPVPGKAIAVPRGHLAGFPAEVAEA